MFCGKCGAEINSNQKFCSKCGTAILNNTENRNNTVVMEKPNKNCKKTRNIIIAILCVIVAIAIAVTSVAFLHNKDNENNNDEVNNTTTNSFEETTEETIKYLDFYENSLDWCGEYGFSATENFVYNVNGMYQDVSADNLGILSAVEYDCDNDGNNELITLSLLPTDDGKLFLSPSIVTNKNEIKKYELSDYSSDKLASQCPVFDAGNIKSYWSGSVISTRVFISDNKLCILHGMYSFAEVGRGENFDSIYIYNLSTTGIELYRHYYLYEEEKIENYYIIPRRENIMKKIISILLAIITILSTFVISASAATKVNAFDVPTSSNYAKVYPLKKTGITIPYTSKALKDRGTTSGKSKTAYIDNANDELYLLDVGTTNGITWAYVSYPVGSKRYKAYISLSDITDAKYSKTHEYCSSALGKFYCSNRKGGSTSSYYYVDKGDKVYILTTNQSSGTYCQILYPTSGNKWRIGWCKYNDVKKYLYGDTSNETNTSIPTTSKFQWPMKNYTVAQGFNKYNSYMANNYGRAYHCGIDIVSSSNTNIYATADGIVKYRGGSKNGANGYHIVIQHNLNGETIYSSYSHLSDYSSCPAVGKTVSKGTKIGVMGNTGRSSGAHLHFAIYKGYTTDPYGYATGSGSNKIQYGSITYYNPSYVIANNKLP